MAHFVLSLLHFLCLGFELVDEIQGSFDSILIDHLDEHGDSNNEEKYQHYEVHLNESSAEGFVEVDQKRVHKGAIESSDQAIVSGYGAYQGIHAGGSSFYSIQGILKRGISGSDGCLYVSQF